MAKKNARQLPLSDDPGPRQPVFSERKNRSRFENQEPPANLPERLPNEPDEEFMEQVRTRETADRLARAERNLGQETITPFQASEMRKLASELARRQIEGLRLYEPLTVQSYFHKSQARMRLARGSNRSGKTLCAAAEVARAVTGQDPFHKYPESHGRFFIVGKDEAHIGSVMFRKLYRPGAFKIIRDARTKKWRAYRPWDAADVARKAETRPAPPLIPHRLIARITWKKKSANIPSMVTMVNGWELSFFSSLGKPPQGQDVDGFWMDEEIVDEDWYPELSARVVDRQGRGLWSATPQAGTDQLYDLHEIAAKERGKKEPSVTEHVLLLSENPHLSAQDKLDFAATLTEEEQRVRVQGDFAMESYKVYPEFSMLVHGVDWRQIPAHWCRYAVIDPGHQVCAVLFAAVPPPSEGDRIYLYQERYLKDCDAVLFGEAMAEATQGQVFQAFLIDQNAAVITDIGSGQCVADQYSRELDKQNVRSVRTGSRFYMASEDVRAGLLKVHGLLHVRSIGTPTLAVLRNALPNFEYEIRRYHKKKVGGMVSDMPDQKRHNHLMDCLRYTAMAEPRYVAPPKRKQPATGALRDYQLKMERKQQREGSNGHIRLGPGSMQ